MNTEQMVAKFKSEMRDRGMRWGIRVATKVVRARLLHGANAARSTFLIELSYR